MLTLKKISRALTSRRTTVFFLIAAIIVSVALNIRYLTDQSIRLDESQSIWFTTRPFIEVIRVSAQDVHLPLYYVLLHFWMQIFSTSILAARTLSLLFFVLTVPLYFLLVKEISNYKIALLAVTMFILSPFVIWFTTEARMYTLFLLTTTVQNWFFIKLIKTKGESGTIGFVVSTVLGLYTHYFFNFIIITQGIYLVGRWIQKSIEMKGNFSRLQTFLDHKTELVHYIKLVLLAYVVILPWIVYFLHSGGGQFTSPQITPPTTYNIFQTFVNFLFGFQTTSIQSVLISLWPISLVFMFLAFTEHKRFKSGFVVYFLLLLVLPIALGFIASYVRPIFLTRYFIFITPALFFLLAWVLVNTTGKAYSFITVPIILVMLASMVYQNLSAETPVKENYEAVSQYLEETARPQDVIAVTPPFTIYPIEYNYEGYARITTIPEWDRYSYGAIPAFSREDLESRLEEYKSMYENIYVVYSYDQGYEEEVRAYLDQNFETIDTRSFSYNLYLRGYKLKYTSN